MALGLFFLLGILANAPQTVADELPPANAPAFQHAYDMAAGHLQAGRPIAAQLWLRRAFGMARTPEQKAMLRAGYRVAAEANPITFNLTGRHGPVE
ncbi:MAG: hypothetical protein U5N55_13500 [Cypionkella sp.]|nr:hypothetical protein [Cypionkella sp.]